ncbi:MAG: DNA repair protein RecN [Alphaproteobacteria bacterium]|nr:DNA repair protein RecN [Alphaproteobacteria bacterium]
MLTRLVIHDVVLIEKLSVPFERGLNVFTGETGAGKSILLDALGLALGERSDAALVRPGAAQASVAAEFVLKKDHAVFALAEEHGLNAENPVILRRVIGEDVKKNRAFFNDQPISVGLLKQFGESLLEIHGQFETHGLLNAATHRGLLDAFAGLQKLRQKTAQAFAAWKEITGKWQAAQTTSERARAEEDFLRAACRELEDLAPQTGEAETLAAQRMQLQHREKILDALNAATLALDGERGACAALSQAGKAVARVSDKAEGLPDILAAIDRAANESVEASQQLARFLSALDARPDALQRIEERLFALRAAARKHNAQTGALPDVLRDLQKRLALLSDESGQISKLAEQAAKARHAYVKLAEDLSAKRKAAAGKLEKAIAKELPPLKLERAKFMIDLSRLPEDQWGEEGVDRVAFQASTNVGAAPGPLQKIASGGELARFMLALKTVLAAADPVPVLVFDEVDTGIGGAVASAVGERLAHLAKDVQILVVTHSPQVASRGAHHLRVAKRIVGKQTVTEVDVLDKQARREEIARMLAGAKVTDAARDAADSLLGG